MNHCECDDAAAGRGAARGHGGSGFHFFAGRGHPVKVADGALAANGYLAGSASRRAADLMAAFTDPEVRLVVPISGGRGAAQLVERLDYDAIRADPKVFTGMSDPSVLGNAIAGRAGVLTLHGPSGYDFTRPQVDAATENAFWRMVGGRSEGHTVEGPGWRVVQGAGETYGGPVLGGHLGTFRALVGTPWMPDLTGAVLMVEEAFVPWADGDAGLTRLRVAGVFDRVAAVVVGVPVDCARGEAPDDEWDELIRRCVGGRVPLVTNVELGHTARKIPFVLGGTVRLDLRSEPFSLRYETGLVAP